MTTQSVEELTVRVHIASGLIKMLHQDDDPRAPGAIEELQEQQRSINEVLVAKIKARREERGEPEPLPIVISCKPAVLAARALRR